MKTERAVEPESNPQRSWGALQYRDFRLFWAARAISVAGDRISLLALPTVAILILYASPAQVGVLNAAGRVIGYGALPVGSLLGGFLGQALAARLGERTGLAIALVIAALVAGSSALALLGTRSFVPAPDSGG